MDLVRFGIVIRALRRRRGWRQVDLAAASGVSQNLISLIERGHSDRLALGTLVRIAGALDARLKIEIRWRGGELERLLDEDHGALTAQIAHVLEAAGWDAAIEVTYAVYRQQGSIDLLAWHAPTRSLLVIEIKTEVTSGEATLRKLDEKVRLGAGIALERFGWRAATISRLLVVQESTTARRRVGASALFDAALPSRGATVRRWLRAPSAGIAGLLFLPLKHGQRDTSGAGGRHRVRRPRAASLPSPAITEPSHIVPDEAEFEVTILTNRT